MAKTNEQVAHLFAHHQAGSSNNLHSDGTTLKSYNTPIATWIDGVCFISSDGMSPTTAGKHLSPLRSALSHADTFYSPAFGRGRGEITPAMCIMEAAHAMQEAFNKLCRMRTYVTESIERYETRRAEILSMAARFQVQDLPDMPEATGDLKEKAKDLAIREREKKAEQKRREEERAAQKRADDLQQFNDWLQGVPVLFPSSYRRHENTDHLKVSINGETVVTSQGAEAPLDHVIKALKFYDSRRVTKAFSDAHLNGETCFTPYHTNGHKIHLGAFVLDSIDEQGNVKAGCHRFTVEEIARFRKQWGL
jgi:hypothetical protein